MVKKCLQTGPLVLETELNCSYERFAEFFQCEKNLEADFERLISFMCCAPTFSLGLQTSA